MSLSPVAAPAPSSACGIDIAVAESVDTFGSDAWNRLFPDELEDWSYYRAVERAGLTDFTWLYFAVKRAGELRAVVPAFVTDYRLDTTLQGPLRRVTDAIARWFPRLLRVRMLSLGSPVSEVCHLGFAADADMAERERLLDALLRAVETYSQQHRIGMLAVKDAGAAQDALWTQAGRARGLRRQPGLPTAYLDLPFTSVADYLASLSHATRKDMRRKLKHADELRVEWRDDISDILDDVMRLYRCTFENAALHFEELTPAYFTGVLEALSGRARCATYWLGGHRR